MAGKRGKGQGRSRSLPVAVRKVRMFLDDSESESDATPTKSQLVRIGLRQRWEFASVLNFLKVFKEVIDQDLKMSLEEIETALINANADLALIHTSLLKGIPPVSKNLMHGDAWVTELSKTVTPWWKWVAEGEYPLEAEKGEEMKRYKVLDPTTRLLILKALCEVRALQDDIPRYISDRMKNGTPITAFRKERIGDEIAGITYWYDGDQVLGYRLYKETAKAESNQKNEEKGCLAQPTPESSWETLATNLKEFKKISDNLMSSKCSTEAAVSEIVKTEVIPVLEKLQKKKSQTIKGQGLKRKTLKQKQRTTLLLEDFWNSSGNGTRHSQRLQKLKKYTHDGSNGDNVSERDNLGDSDDEVRAMDKPRVMRLRRSRSTCFDNGNVVDAKGMKKRPRLRATPPTDGSVVIISDSDEESLKEQTDIVSDDEVEGSANGSWGKMKEQDSEGESSPWEESSTSGSVGDEPESSDGGSFSDEPDDCSDSDSDSVSSDDDDEE